MEILKIHNNPERAEWAALTERFTRQEEEITRQVAEILADVKSGGDRSLREITRRVVDAIPGRSRSRPTCAPKPPHSSPPR